MSLYPTPVSYSELKNYLKLADNTSGLETLLTEFLEAATERVYTFCNWDFTRKLTAHPDPTIAPYDEWNYRHIYFIGNGKAYQRTNCSVSLVVHGTRHDPTDQDDAETLSEGSGAGMFVPTIKPGGALSNVLYYQDGAVFRLGHQYSLKLLYQPENEFYPIPQAILLAITQLAAKLFNESGWGNGELGRAEASNVFATRVKLTDLDEQVKTMLHPHRVLAA